MKICTPTVKQDADEESVQKKTSQAEARHLAREALLKRESQEERQSVALGASSCRRRTELVEEQVLGPNSQGRNTAVEGSACALDGLSLTARAFFMRPPPEIFARFARLYPRACVAGNL